MKKILAASIAAVLCMGALTACGDKNESDSKKIGGSSFSLDGISNIDYCSVYNINGNKEIIRDDIDAGIKDSINHIKELEADGGDVTGLKISFSGSKFTAGTGDYGVNGSFIYYDGTYSINNGNINFKYENQRYTNDEKVININDVYEYDKDLAFGISDKLDGLTRDEKTEMMKAEQKMQGYAASVEHMQKMNETGTFVTNVGTGLCFSDKLTECNLLPLSDDRRSYHGEARCELIPKSEFLCVEIYGYELAGNYKSGSDFKLNFNQRDSYIDDPNSSYNFYKESEEQATRQLESLERRCREQYECDSLDTTIEFSNGKWSWYNADGELINNGEYQESRDYKGLISMYITDDSKIFVKTVESAGPLLLYIADDGEIYYPGYVKMN